MIKKTENFCKPEEWVLHGTPQQSWVVTWACLFLCAILAVKDRACLFHCDRGLSLFFSLARFVIWHVTLVSPICFYLELPLFSVFARTTSNYINLFI